MGAPSCPAHADCVRTTASCSVDAHCLTLPGYSYAITLPTEITAAAIVIQYWDQSTNASCIRRDALPDAYRSLSILACSSCACRSVIAAC